MRASIVRIGNSRGLRLPKAVLNACGIGDQVDLSVNDGRIIIEPPRRARAGWAEAALDMARSGDNALLDGDMRSDFDDSDWDW